MAAFAEVGLPVRAELGCYRTEAALHGRARRPNLLISVDEAWSVICEQARPLPSASVALDEAVGAYLTDDIRADRDVPAGDRATMDGYALRAADLARIPAELRIVAEIAAGSTLTAAVGAGECVRIFTGAPLPPGADTVIPVEDSTTGSFASRCDETAVRVLKQASHGSYVLPRGACARQGQMLLPAGTRLGATQVAVCASCGCAEVRVHRRPRVCVLTTGAEIVAPESAAASHEVRDSNGPLLQAALVEAGFPVVAVRRVPDDLALTVRAVRDALASADAVIVTGGASAGRCDYVPAAVLETGCAVHYHGVAMKPGKPQLFATSPAGQPIFGLPGNPLSATVGLSELVTPALRRLAGCPTELCRRRLWLPLAEDVRVRGDRQHFVTGRILATPQGSRVQPVQAVASADLVTAGSTEGCFSVASGTRVVPSGTLVPFQPWSWQS